MRMATKPKTYPYAIYRTDGSYLIHDLTLADYKTLEDALMMGFQAAKLSIGVITTGDVRGVIKQKEPEPVKPDKPALPDMTPAEREWLRTDGAAHGYAHMLPDEDDDEGVDY